MTSESSPIEKPSDVQVDDVVTIVGQEDSPITIRYAPYTTTPKTTVRLGWYGGVLSFPGDSFDQPDRPSISVYRGGVRVFPRSAA